MTRESFAFRSDDQVVFWQMVRAGYGIGFNQVLIRDADINVQRVAPDFPVGTMPTWLAAHNDLKTNLRVRRVFDLLSEHIKTLR